MTLPDDHPVAVFDVEGYPTEDTLDRLIHWDWRDVAGALDFMAAAWHWPDSVRRELLPAEREVLHAEDDAPFLRCATGGWSGNEDLIDALCANERLWARAWRLSTCGGLHIFKYADGVKA